MTDDFRPDPDLDPDDVGDSAAGDEPGEFPEDVRNEDVGEGEETPGGGVTDA